MKDIIDKSLAAVHTDSLNEIKNNKEEYKNKSYLIIKNNGGITLIALVVTIVILIILAGISIIGVTKNGIFSKAKIAKEKYTNAQKIENKKLQEYEKSLTDSSRDNENGFKESSIIGEVTVETEEIYGTSGVFKINVDSKTNMEDIRGYGILINNELVRISENSEMEVLNLTKSTNYNVVGYALDKYNNIKKSQNYNIKTADVEETFLYKNGKMLSSDLIGNWTYSNEGNCRIDLKSYEYMSATSTVGNAVMGCIYTSKKVDLSQYKTLKASVYAEPGHYENFGMYPMAFGITNSPSYYATSSNNWIAYTPIIYDGETNTYSVNIENFNSNYYIQFSQYLKLKIYKIWLEK